MTPPRTDFRYENNGVEPVVAVEAHRDTSGLTASPFCYRNCSRRRMAAFSVLGVGLLTTVICVVSVWPGWSDNKDDHSIRGHNGLRVAAFNIQHFGRKLMRDDTQVGLLLRIFQRYDVILVQEVRDSTLKALDELNRRLNSASTETWAYNSSAPLGRSKYYREQYVFFYKVKAVRVVESFQIDDAAEDVYEREPFGVDIEYTSVSCACKRRVVLLALHTKPTMAEEELRYLPATIRHVAAIASPRVVGVVALGDFNADCDYLRKKARAQMEIFRDPDFVSLIPDDADTAVSRKSDCAYDRVIFFGHKLTGGQGAVYNYQEALELNDTLAAAISDHFPVEFSLY